MHVIRSNSDNTDFQQLIRSLDEELAARNGILQGQYTQYNIISDLGTVVVGYHDDRPSGCGCFKIFEETTVEIKRMFVTPENRGSGIAKMILQELEKWAIEKGYRKAVLETGVKQYEAIAFYTKLGYQRMDNYGQYTGNSNSLCMSKDLFNLK
jgi:GNAT superfamily N-acetyltransferase